MNPRGLIVTETESQERPTKRITKIDLEGFRKVVSPLLAAFAVIFVASFTFSAPWPARIILGSCILSLGLSLALSLRKGLSVRQLEYWAALIPAALLAPLILWWAGAAVAINIGWSIGALLIIATAVLSNEKKKLPGMYFFLIGLVLSQLFLPWSLVYRSANNPVGPLDVWPTVEVYGNITNANAVLSMVNFTDTTHHSRLFSTVRNGNTAILKFDALLPNRMNYTVSLEEGSYPPFNGPVQSCQPILALNVDSQRFPFNIRC